MILEPGKFYILRYSLPQGGTIATKAADAFRKVGHLVLGVEDYGQDKPSWITILIDPKGPVDVTPGEEQKGVILSSIDSVTKWGGLEKVALPDLFKLYLAIPPEWDFDSLLGHISSESGFNPKAKSPRSSARGLIQMTNASQKDTESYPLGDTFESQIAPLVKYFAKAGRAMQGADYKLWGFANGVIGRDGWGDDVVLYKKGSEAANNKTDHGGFLDAAGNMTIASVRKWWDWWTREGYIKAKGGKASAPPGSNANTKSKAAGKVALAAAAVLGLFFAFAGRRR